MNSRLQEIKKLRKEGLTYSEIGQRFGITKERVRQLINRKPPEPPAPKLMLTTSEVSSILGLHPNTVRRWTQNGTLQACRVSPRGDRRYRKEDIDTFLKINTSKPAENDVTPKR